MNITIRIGVTIIVVNNSIILILVGIITTISSIINITIVVTVCFSSVVSITIISVSITIIVSVSITLITDTNNTAGYVEASRLVIGDYWSPTYNTSFGLMAAPKSLSTNSRTESGDLVTNRGIQYNTMSFDLTWLNPADRLIFTKIIKSNGINKGLLISLFPDAAEDYDKEQTFQIYGKLTQVPDLTHPMYTMYSSKVDIEEI
jgi:hypothetical protein